MYVIEKQLSDLPSRGVDDSPIRRVGESSTHRLSKSASRRLPDSAVGESASKFLQEKSLRRWVDIW
jgi:hypothetical protein